MTKTNKASQPVPNAIVADKLETMAGGTAQPAAPEAEPEAKPLGNVHTLDVKSKRPNAFLDTAKDLSVELQHKVQSVGTARQILAEAADLYRQGTGQHNEAVLTANKAMLRLYRDRTTLTGAGTPLVSAEEVTAILGDIFGYKAKKDGSPSKTPDALGEVLRKRVVRAIAAHDYIMSDPSNRNDGQPEPETDGGTFYKGLPSDEVYALVSNLGEGASDFNLWTFYDKTAELKKDHTQRVAAAFDPKRMAALAAALNTEGAALKIINTGGLKAAFTGLIETLLMIGEEMAEIEADKAKAVEAA